MHTHLDENSIQNSIQSQIGEIHNLVTFVYVNGLHIQKHNTYIHTCNYFSPLHVSDTHFWNNQTIKAFHSGVPDKIMLILDLFAEEDPVWIRTELFFGKPFIWCMQTSWYFWQPTYI